MQSRYYRTAWLGRVTLNYTAMLKQFLKVHKLDPNKNKRLGGPYSDYLIDSSLAETKKVGKALRKEGVELNQEIFDILDARIDKIISQTDGMVFPDDEELKLPSNESVVDIHKKLKEAEAFWKENPLSDEDKIELEENYTDYEDR